jgi:hypothetical protein
MLTGTCVHTGITAILNFHWSVFKFSLVFNENPEGNSYYLHKAVLEYNQVTKYRLLKIHIPELWTHLIQNLLPKKYI